MLRSIFEECCPQQDLERVLNILFSYLFDKIGKYEYRILVGNKDIAKKVWSAASDSGYVLKNCKLYLWSRDHAKKSGLAVSPAKFEIYKEDLPVLRKISTPCINVKYKPYSLFDFSNMEASILTSSSMKTYIGKFTSKKLIFLLSYGQTRESISSTLLCAALFALRKHYPFYESELHALNICKTAIHNAGMGLIEYWTRGKRNALLKENGVFQAVHVQYDVLNSVGVAPEHNDEFRLNIKSLVSITSTLPAIQQRFLSAAAGLYDPGVSMFIGADNSDIVDSWKYPRYMAHLRNYFGLTEDQQQELLLSMRQRLA